jgi:hypothetical protein
MADDGRREGRSSTAGLVLHGIRTSIRNNASAYPFSVFITGSLAAVDLVVGDRSVGRIFLFVLGATVAFATIEGIASHGFRDRLRPEHSEVVVLGSALAMVSVTAAIAAVWGTVELLSGAPAWFAAPFVGTVVYLVTSSLEMALARRREEQQGHADEEEREDEEEPDDGEDPEDEDPDRAG